MKALSFALLLGLTGSAIAQGTVNFANDNSSLIRISPFSGLPSEPLKGGGYTQFFWAPANYPPLTPWTQTVAPVAWIAENVGWSLAGLPASVGPTPGIFDGGTLTIPGASPGTTIQAVVLAWYNAPYFGSSIDNAVSTPFLIQLGDPSGTPAAITGPGGFTGLTITMIPEPSAVALLGLGLVALCCRRGRRPLPTNRLQTSGNRITESPLEPALPCCNRSHSIHGHWG
jgi:hypothetical protein